MSPKDHFDSLWNRCNELETLYNYLKTHVAEVVSLDEMLRAEWVARVSALDLYFHELVNQNLLKIFDGTKPICPGFEKFTLSMGSVIRILNATDSARRVNHFQIEVAEKIGLLTFQDPEKIADGIRIISPIEFWNEIALSRGATQSQKSQHAKTIKRELSLIIQRRNKIAHEGDLQPGYPRIPWPIDYSQLQLVKIFIQNLVDSTQRLNI